MSRKPTISHGKKRELIESSDGSGRGVKKGLFFIVLIAAISLAGASFHVKSGRRSNVVVTETEAKRSGSSSDVMTIPLSDITREATFYQANVGGVPVRFFVMKSSDGVVRSAFDSCDTCAEKLMGYRQEGDFMVCNSCDQRFPSNKINVLRGGCNPVPLNNDVDGDTLKIKVADIQHGARYFNFRRF